MAEQYVELLRATSSSSALAQGAERNRMMLAIKMTKAALLAVACLPSAEAFGSIPSDELHLQPQKYMHFPEFYDIPRKKIWHTVRRPFPLPRRLDRSRLLVDCFSRT